MTYINDLFSTENKYKIKEERYQNSKPHANQIVIGVHRRVSTGRQAIEGDSLEMQSELAQKHSQKIGGVIYKYYTEEGLSAKKNGLKDREVMQEIIQDIEEGNINYLIAYRRDRLFRNQTENMWFWSLLAEHDCQIYLTASGETQVNVEELKKAGTTKMMESILAMMAEMESEITSTRVSDTMLSKAQRGEYTGGSIPVGYTRNEEGKFIPQAGMKELAATIEKLYLQGYGLHSIARFLNGDEVKGLPQLEAPVPKPIEGEKSDVWNHRNINTILFNPFYTGHISYESKKNLDVDRVIKKVDYIEPIRTIEKQKQLNAFRNRKNEGVKNPRSYNTPFLLSGLIFCGECGEKMITQSTQPKGSNKRFSYYRCPNTTSNYKSKGCTNHGYRKGTLEELIVKATKEKTKKLMSDENLKSIAERADLDKISYANELQKLEKKINSKERELSNITRMIIKIENEMLQEEYIKEQEKILEEINKLKERLIRLTEDITNSNKSQFNYQEFYDLINRYGEMADNSPLAVQKQMIEAIFKNIKVYKNGDVNIQLRNEFSEIIDIASDSVTNDQDEVIIGFGTGGSPMVIKDINVIKEAIAKFTISFNYFEYSKAIAENFISNLKSFTFLTNPLLNPENAHMIDISKLKNVNTHHYKNQQNKQMHIVKRYFEQMGNMSDHTFRLFYNSEPIKFTDVLKILRLANATLEEYLEYLNDLDSELSVMNEETIETILHIYSPKKEGRKHEHVLFKDVAYCACGESSIRKINRTSPVSYYCKSKVKSYNLQPCEYKATQELLIVEKIKEDKGYFVKSRTEVNEIVKKIIIKNKFDFIIIYK